MLAPGCFPEKNVENIKFFFPAEKSPNLIYNYMAADSRLQTTKSALRLQPCRKIQCQSPLSSAVISSHYSKTLFTVLLL